MAVAGRGRKPRAGAGRERLRDLGRPGDLRTVLFDGTAGLVRSIRLLPLSAM
jgi:hypothetical protein